MNRPNEINIVGVVYRVEYCDRPSEVDVFKRQSLWGQIDYWTRTIRVYDAGRQSADLWQTIMHEILHGLAEHLHLTCLGKGGAPEDSVHDELDRLATGLVDVFARNGWAFADSKE